ncbi:MAG: hypothetical protein QNJ85_12810 [Gammaproteobacteria bacterium]|nr:hypothetical protein [Gammaproteobacteria bacterium]
MHRNAENIPQDANPSSLVGRLARNLSGLLEAHAGRTESPRVYPATRQDGRDSAGERAVPAQLLPETETATRSSSGGLWRWLGKAYAAHEARLARLRVYDPRL